MTPAKFLPRTAIAALLSSALLAPMAMAQHAGHSAPSAAPSAPPASHGSHQDMKAMMKKMNDEMASMRMSGDADIDFAKMMRIHHIGAIDMAEAQLQGGKNPQMLKLAREIIAAQNQEIAVFDRFLASKGHPQTKPAAGKK
ncbi:MAG: DUF305 domain-containing protein [Polaromonas sp.]|nr:DUF305 domain-containing protein [Polaromonas sp.]